MSHGELPDDFRPDDSPIAWFGEMLIAIDRGDSARAAQARRRLNQLGWRVTRGRGRHAPPEDLPRDEDHRVDWFTALLRGLNRNDAPLVEEARDRLEGLGFIVVPTLPDRKGVA
jgi:hypothetical protein